jgi:type II secretory pathway pseudopilin PulG
MEPERKIEKLLRAYAKKRRAGAGDLLKLHPAARRLLQGEVARRAPKPDEEEPSVTLWESFRQRWALFAGFALVIFFGAALFLPALSSSKKKAQAVTAMNNLRQIGLAAQIAAGDNNGKLPASLDALTNELGSDKILTDPESGKPFIYVASGEKLDGLSSNSVLAYSLADKKGHAVLFADGRVEVVNSSKFSELTNRGLTELALAKDSVRRQFTETSEAITVASGTAAAAPPVPGQTKPGADRSDVKLADLGNTAPSVGELAANAPAAGAPTADRLATAHGAAGNYSTTQTKSVQFASTVGQNFDSSAQNSFKNTAAVLANFQVQQNGNAIRVVDADGSVYDGALQPEKMVAQKEQVSAGTVSLPMDQEKSSTSHDEPQMAQNYFFRVAGTNLTLKQNVVFAGNLLANSGATANLQQANNRNGNFGGGGSIGGQLQSVLTNQLPWSNSRIAGTAVVDDTNSIEINAVPQAP